MKLTKLMKQLEECDKQTRLEEAARQHGRCEDNSLYNTARTANHLLLSFQGNVGKPHYPLPLDKAMRGFGRERHLKLSIALHTSCTKQLNRATYARLIH